VHLYPIFPNYHAVLVIFSLSTGQTSLNAFVLGKVYEYHHKLYISPN